MSFAPASPARISPSLQARAGSILDRFNMDNLNNAVDAAKPFAYGVGTLVAATALDGFAEGMKWEYPDFMKGEDGDRFLGKIDWRLYGTALSGIGYMLLDSSEYEEYQTDVAAVGVGLLGSWLLSPKDPDGGFASLWGGPKQWGDKLGTWLYGKTSKAVATTPGAGAAPKAVAPGSPAAPGVKGVDGIEVGGGAAAQARLRKLQHAADKLREKGELTPTALAQAGLPTGASTAAPSYGGGGGGGGGGGNFVPVAIPREEAVRRPPPHHAPPHHAPPPPHRGPVRMIGGRAHHGK